MLVKAAIQKGVSIYTGRSYLDIFRNNPNVKLKHGLRGFVDDKGKFIILNEAEKHARDCGQLKNNLIGPVLRSGDLW